MAEIKTPQERMSDKVMKYYLQHPDLICQLLLRLGAQCVQHRGAEIRSTCPIHYGNNSQAFAVWLDRDVPIWKCHTDCVAKGSLVRLIMKKYPQANAAKATVWLARFAGLQIDGQSIHVSEQTLEEEALTSFSRRLGLSSNTSNNQPTIFPESMVQWSMDTLYSRPGAHALDLLTGTGKNYLGEDRKNFPISVLRQFGVGFVPGNTWVKLDERDPKIKRGWFEDRISFPWRNLENACIGFAGRRIDNVSDLKYKTLTGTKRALALFGLSDPHCQAAIHATRVLHFVEGYGDVMRGHTCKCPNIAAVGGTELSPQQLAIIRQYPLQYAVMYFDPDGPGATAAAKAAEQLADFTKVLVAHAPAKKDPADLWTPSLFWDPINKATPFIPRRLV